MEEANGTIYVGPNEAGGRGNSLFLGSSSSSKVASKKLPLQNLGSFVDVELLAELNRRSKGDHVVC